jgi:hypothetical protein
MGETGDALADRSRGFWNPAATMHQTTSAVSPTRQLPRATTHRHGEGPISSEWQAW